MSDRSPTVRRRAFVASAGAAALGAIAGCLGGDSDDEDGDTDNGSDGNESTPDGNQSDPGGNSSGNGGPDENGNPDENGSPDEPPASVFDRLDTAVAGHPQYAAWIPGGGESTFHTNFERVQAVEAYSIDDVDPSADRPFPEIDTLAEGLAADNALFPLILLGQPAVGASYPFIGTFSLAGVTAEQEEPIMRVEQATVSGEVIVLDGELDRQRLEALDTVAGSTTQSGYTIRQSQPENLDAVPFGVDDDTVVFPFGNEGERAPRERLEAALDTTTSGISVDTDADWLLEHCGEGAFVFASTQDPSDSEMEPPDGAEPNFGVDQERAERFRERVEEPGTAMVSVLDRHDEGHVTRNGFAFESEAAMPPPEELGDLLAETARDRTVVTEQNLAIVEAFW